MKRILRLIVFSVIGIVVLIVGCVGFFLFTTFRSTRALDAVALSPTNYQPAAVELATLCQSDPSFFSQDATSDFDPFDPVWAPPSVAKLHPEDIDIAPDHARVTWGGGFYHCGWELRREGPTADRSGVLWALSFTRENGSPEVLKDFTVAADQHLTEDQFVRQVLSEFDRRLAARADEGMMTSEVVWYSAASRCAFLAKHHRTDLLPVEVAKSAANYPHDWRDALLAYLLAHTDVKPAAAAALRHWADQSTGPAAWVYAAYAFYQAGDDAAGDAAVQKAVVIAGVDPTWIENDTPQYELGMAARLYSTGKFRDCVRLCDAIIGTRHSNFATALSVRRLLDIADVAARSSPAPLPTFDKFTASDPFGGLDLSLFASDKHPTTSP